MRSQTYGHQLANAQYTSHNVLTSIHKGQQKDPRLEAQMALPSRSLPSSGPDRVGAIMREQDTTRNQCTGINIHTDCKSALLYQK
jgi:hypothetical protein